MSKNRKSEKAAHGVIMCLAFCLLLMVGAIFLVFGIMEVHNHDCVIPFLPHVLIGVGAAAVMALFPCFFFLLYGALLPASYIVFTNHNYHQVEGKRSTNSTLGGIFSGDSQLGGCDEKLLYVGTVGLILLWNAFAVLLFHLLMSSGYVEDRVEDYQSSFKNCCKDRADDVGSAAETGYHRGKRGLKNAADWSPRSTRTPSPEDRRRSNSPGYKRHKEPPANVKATKLVERGRGRRRERKVRSLSLGAVPAPQAKPRRWQGRELFAYRQQPARVPRPPHHHHPGHGAGAGGGRQGGNRYQIDFPAVPNNRNQQMAGGGGQPQFALGKADDGTPPQIVLTPHQKHVHLESKPNPLGNS